MEFLVKRKKQKVERIKDIINNVIKKLGKTKYKTNADIIIAWQEVSGDDIIHHAQPARIRKKVLIVEVDSSAWLYTLNLKKKTLLEGIRDILGRDKIEDIRFRIGEIQ